MKETHFTTSPEQETLMLKLLEQKVMITMSLSEMKQLKALLMKWFELQKYAPEDAHRRAFKQAVLKLIGVWLEPGILAFLGIKITPDLMQAIALKEVLDECLIFNSSIDAGVVNKIVLQIVQQL